MISSISGIGKSKMADVKPKVGLAYIGLGLLSV